MTNSHVFVWWLEQIISYIGLIVCTTLCIIVIKSLRSVSSNELAPTLRFLIYAVHIISVLFFISNHLTLTILPLFRLLTIRINTRIACEVTYILISCLGAGLLLAIINLFFERLRLSFSDTELAISTSCHILFRIILTCVWTAIGVIYINISDATPYNIYEKRVDFINGTTCSTHAKSKTYAMTFLYSLVAATMSISNLIVLFLFISKLYNILKKTTSNTTPNVSDNVSVDFIIIMKHQTMLVSIAVISSVVFWSLEATLQIGQTFANCDFIVSVFVCFLTFKFNKKYFKLFKCDLLAFICCKWFQILLIIPTQSTTIIELTLAKQISASSDNDHPDINSTDLTAHNKSIDSIATNISAKSCCSTLDKQKQSN